MYKKEMIENLRKNLNNQHLNLPKDIGFTEQEGTLTMELTADAIGLGKKPKNMQDDSAAFEGWALALYAHLPDPKETMIILKAPIPESVPSDMGLGHYNRFLYRALRFSEQFRSWFQLAPELSVAAARLKAELGSAKFVNNFPEYGAGERGTLENKVEALLAGDNGLLRSIASAADCTIGGNPIFRQLPVGLFREEKSNSTHFFSGGKSAIDLWTECGDTISIFELKAQNKKIGMVTELYFYANYIYDMFCRGGCPSFLPSIGKEQHRGYSALLGSDGEKIHEHVQAFFLYDDNHIHPLISEEVVNILNQGAEQIQYARLSYGLESILKQRDH